MKKLSQLFSVILILTVLAGCPPYSETQITTKPTAEDNIESLLSKTSTGADSLAYFNQLKQQGYSIKIQFVSSSEISSLNGHNGGGFQRNGSEIIIFINNSLNQTEQAHVVVHELVHIKDDFEIDEFLKNRSHIDFAAQDFVSNYQYNGTNSYSSEVITYVLGTLFCSEARAYTKNQNMNDQGLTTNLFAKGSQLPQFIDQNYIHKFNVAYGTSAESMKNWCLSFSSMTAIQNSLSF